MYSRVTNLSQWQLPPFSLNMTQCDSPMRIQLVTKISLQTVVGPQVDVLHTDIGVGGGWLQSCAFS